MCECTGECVFMHVHGGAYMCVHLCVQGMHAGRYMFACMCSVHMSIWCVHVVHCACMCTCTHGTGPVSLQFPMWGREEPC